MPRTIRALVAALAIAAGLMAAPAAHAVAHDTWTHQPATVSWG